MTPFPTTRQHQNDTPHRRLRMSPNVIISGAKTAQNDGKTTPEPRLNRIWSALEMALQTVPCMAPIMAPWVASLAGAKWRLNGICSGVPNPPLALDLLFVFIKKKKGFGENGKCNQALIPIVKFLYSPLTPNTQIQDIYIKHSTTCLNHQIGTNQNPLCAWWRGMDLLRL